jgi:hypothetical protein
MASRHADRQRRYRQRLRAQGLVHVQAWVTPEQAEAIRRILAERGGDAPAAEYGGRVWRRAPSGAASGAE